MVPHINCDTHSCQLYCQNLAASSSLCLFPVPTIILFIVSSCAHCHSKGLFGLSYQQGPSQLPVTSLNSSPNLFPQNISISDICLFLSCFSCIVQGRFWLHQPLLSWLPLNSSPKLFPHPSDHSDIYSYFYAIFGVSFKEGHFALSYQPRPSQLPVPSQASSHKQFIFSIMISSVSHPMLSLSFKGDIFNPFY